MYKINILHIIICKYKHLSTLTTNKSTKKAKNHHLIFSFYYKYIFKNFLEEKITY